MRQSIIGGMIGASLVVLLTLAVLAIASAASGPKPNPCDGVIPGTIAARVAGCVDEDQRDSRRLECVAAKQNSDNAFVQHNPC
jgi:hypothetical protein